uniref:PAP_RNA-bind domain-containing protein n=1 Tax=Meloidogyne hapla TaxID=6305 RepID=A0A1I8BNZ2_MELHA
MSWTTEEEIEARKDLFLSKRSEEEIINLQKHANLLMVVLIPGYPEQNCTFNVNYSTRQIIQKELIDGNNMLINVKNTTGEYESITNSWKVWLNGIKFLEKYKHFLLILCFVNNNNPKEAENYCRFVESRIRLELVFTIEQNQKQIKYTHSTDAEKCLPREIKGIYSEYYIQYWWVGIETYNQIEHLEFGKSNEEDNILIKFTNAIKEKTPFILGKTGGSLKLFYFNSNNDNKILNECRK